MHVAKDVKKFFDDLRCPLCDGQLDGLLHPVISKLYCVNDNNEYSVDWVAFQDHPSYELITHTFGNYEYRLSISKYGPDEFRNRITRYDLNLNTYERHKYTVELLNLIGSRLMFFRNKMEEEILIKKCGIYNLFS